MSSIPKDAASRGRAFPTPRTWDYAAQLLAIAMDAGAGDEVQRLLVYGAVGAPVGHEFLTWRSSLDLPDPEGLLANPLGDALKGLRPDRVHVALQGVLAAYTSDPTPDRWTAAMGVCVGAAKHSSLDTAVPVVRALLRPGRRPAGAELPAGLTVFVPALQLAGLL